LFAAHVYCFVHTCVCVYAQALSARNARIGAWSAMALGETMDIGGVCTEEELEELRKDRTELKSTLADMKSAMAASKNPDAGLKMKVKELKKDAKKLEKENAKLLEGLQRAQSSSGGGGDGGGDGGEEKNKLLAKIEKLTKKMEKMKTEKSSSGDPPSSGGGADPKELAAAKQETASLAAKLSEVQGKYDKLKGEFKDSQSLAGKNQEEIMNTMAQEVEKLEKGKAAVEKELEGAMEKLEKGKAAVEKKLEGAMEKLESALEKNKKMEKINEKLKGASGELAGQLTVIRKKGEGVSRDFGKLKQFVQLQVRPAHAPQRTASGAGRRFKLPSSQRPRPLFTHVHACAPQLTPPRSDGNGGAEDRRRDYHADPVRHGGVHGQHQGLAQELRAGSERAEEAVQPGAGE